MAVSDLRPFLIRLLTVARAETAALTALFVAALGVTAFVEIADDMTEADGRAEAVIVGGLVKLNRLSARASTTSSFFAASARAPTSRSTRTMASPSMIGSAPVFAGA